MLHSEPWNCSEIFDTAKHDWVEVNAFYFIARYELAQQLQPQSEDPLGEAAVAHEVQVEMEGESLPQPPAATAEQQSMLGLSEAEVVNGTQTVTLEAPLTDQALVQGEGERKFLCRLNECTFWSEIGKTHCCIPNTKNNKKKRKYAIVVKTRDLCAIVEWK